jgi:hypothetical protein
MNGRMNGRMNGSMNGSMNGRMNGRMNAIDGLRETVLRKVIENIEDCKEVLIESAAF